MPVLLHLVFFPYDVSILIVASVSGQEFKANPFEFGVSSMTYLVWHDVEGCVNVIV